jgi:thymidine kinase
MLTFYTGLMGAGKSRLLLAMLRERESENVGAFVVSPGGPNIRSRNGNASEAQTLAPGSFSLRLFLAYSHIFVDEIHFATRDDVDVLRHLCDHHSAHVHAFGLCSDFSLNIFAASQRLVQCANEVRSVGAGEQECSRCRVRPAAAHLKESGCRSLQIEAGPMYSLVCLACWHAAQSD